MTTKHPTHADEPAHPEPAHAPAATPQAAPAETSTNMTDPGWSNNPPGPPEEPPTEAEPAPPPGWSNVGEAKKGS